MSNDQTDDRLPCPCCGGKGTIPDKDTIGGRMKDYRIKRKVSMRATATKMGLSYGYLSDLENGRRGWTDDRVTAFKAAVEAIAQPEEKR